MSEILNYVNSIYDELVAIRRDIHAHPETGMKEFRTTELIRRELKEMGMDEIQEPLPTGTVGLLHGKKGPGKCVALRADIDALPVVEETGLPFSSVNEGVMHACGHDLHATMLLGIAKTLCHMRDQFAGTVKFIFQPSEDLLPGGSRAMVEAGVMENPHVDAIFGMHVGPSENDTIGTKEYISGGDLEMTINGKGGHGSAPHTADDAIVCAGYLITALQQIVSRRVDPMDMAVFSIGMMDGGEAVNIITGKAHISGVARYYSDTARQTVMDNVKRICEGVGIAFGCKVDLRIGEGYAATFNDSDLIDLIDRSVTAELGAEKVRHLSQAFTGSEDFSFYSRLTGTPGAFVFIDAGHGESCVSLHNGKIVFDENVMKSGVAGMARVAMEYLKG